MVVVVSPQPASHGARPCNAASTAHRNLRRERQCCAQTGTCAQLRLVSKLILPYALGVGGLRRWWHAAKPRRTHNLRSGRAVKRRIVRLAAVARTACFGQDGHARL
jgi:hypothetical protein